MKNNITRYEKSKSCFIPEQPTLDWAIKVTGDYNYYTVKNGQIEFHTVSPMYQMMINILERK